MTTMAVKEPRSRRAVRTRVERESFLPEPKTYRVVIADDQAVVRHGLRAMIEMQPGVEISGEATTGV
jgi:hypothetical protein